MRGVSMFYSPVGSNVRNMDKKKKIVEIAAINQCYVWWSQPNAVCWYRKSTHLRPHIWLSLFFPLSNGIYV